MDEQKAIKEFEKEWIIKEWIIEALRISPNLQSYIKPICKYFWLAAWRKYGREED